MNKSNWTSSDVAYLLTVATPLMILAGLFTAAAVNWQLERGKLSEVIQDVVARETVLDGSTAPRLYEARTSAEQTATWKQILDAAEEHNDKYGGPFAFGSDADGYEAIVPPGEDWPVSEILSRYADDAEPILAQLQTLLDSDEAIWVPILFDSFSTLLNEAQQTREVVRVLHYSFLHAIHSGDNERALMIVRISDHVFGKQYQPAALVDELVRVACNNVIQAAVARSLGPDVWSPEELARLEQILSQPFDWESQWRDTIQADMLMVLPPMADGRLGGSEMGAGPSNLPFRFAPSQIRELLEDYRSIVSLDGAGSNRHVEAIGRISQAADDGPPTASIDRWLQVPLMDAAGLLRMATPAYEAFASAYNRAANSHRFTRTVLAIRRFEVEHDRWPQSLQELSRFGLPVSIATTVSGQSFPYRVTEQGEAIIQEADEAGMQMLSMNSEHVERIVMKR